MSGYISQWRVVYPNGKAEQWERGAVGNDVAKLIGNFPVGEIVQLFYSCLPFTMECRVIRNQYDVEEVVSITLCFKGNASDYLGKPLS
jgi:hypothetical protein